MKDFLIAIILAFLVFFLYLSDLKMYGGTWDELFFHIDMGRRYTDFLKSGNLDEIMKYGNSAWFPPVAPTFAKLIADISFVEKFYPDHTDRFHIAAVLFGALTAATVFLIVKKLSKNVFISVFATLLLVSYPQFMVQAHNNIRDMGLTFFTV